ncbi:MAG: hypothetical protein ACYDB7_05855 [Mycobacteriales bacterium]
MEWLSIEVFDPDIPASAWQRAHQDGLIETALAPRARVGPVRASAPAQWRCPSPRSTPPGCRVR